MNLLKSVTQNNFWHWNVLSLDINKPTFFLGHHIPQNCSVKKFDITEQKCRLYNHNICGISAKKKKSLQSCVF